LFEWKGEEANQDVRGRRDCQAERLAEKLAKIGLEFSGFPLEQVH